MKKKVYYLIYDQDEDHYRLAYRYDEDVDTKLLVIDTKVGGISERQTGVRIRDAMNAAEGDEMR